MKVSETKTIDTLVEDIYNLVDTGKKNPDQEALFALGSSIMEAVRRQLWMATSDSPGRLRMSNIGKPCSRSLWYDINGDEQAEKFSPQTRLKFMIGDIVEAFIIYLAKEAGHHVSNQQAEIEMDGIKGHIDCFIDDELVDIKSASSFAMKKFKNGTLPDDDPFGYISQMSGYGNALNKKRGTFLAFDKSSGELATYTHSQLENTKLKIKEVKEAVELPEPPDRCFETVKDRQTGRQKLGVNCSYCSHKHTCWDGELDLKFRSGRPVFFVGKGEENAHSF
jgi:hypothetical protein|tara:strand:- start:818 stop:1654 length:837 start_codon:yes stop_codon:yes gene_type:complete